MPSLSPCPLSGRPEVRMRTDRDGGGGLVGRTFDVKRFAIHDGPGIRSTVFFTGCPMRCAWCHNPEAFALVEPGHAESELCLRDWTVEELVRELERDIPYYDRSGGGITLSGGEPLEQAEFSIELLKTCRRRELHTALDTSGCAESGVLEKAAANCDLILYDLKAIDDEVHRRWTGVSNVTILENLEMLDGLDVETWIRVPLIPGVNDDPDAIEAMIGFLRGTRFRRVSVLPYHRIAAGKYARLGLTNRMAGVEPPSGEEVEAVRAQFAGAGFDPWVGR
ncbi:glycyl-radical enzyme activating protein [Haloferula sp. A504]|uniref:glycyl-radical enzyme activating protein n=1 Tax=Haloferula sp. A504 TaxID=3373601 RepID=UPI0031CAD96D|nr:glycyl-radical enzyme activating protein [Verrucomicrobiaceae bacterium E54]